MRENIKNQFKFFLASYYAGNSRRNGCSLEGKKKVVVPQKEGNSRRKGGSWEGKKKVPRKLTK